MLQLQNFLSALQLCLKSNKFFFSCNKTEFTLRVIKILIKYNYIVGFKNSSVDKRKIIVFLKLNADRSRPFITSCKLISTCSRPIYAKVNNCASDRASLLILSTSKGILSYQEALSAQVGGLVLFKVV